LHAEGKLVRLDHSLDTRIDFVAIEKVAVHRLHKFKLKALRGGVEVRVLDVADPSVSDGLPFVSDAGCLASRGKKCAAVVLSSAVSPCRLNRNEPW
jgi:hypothetical protein